MRRSPLISALTVALCAACSTGGGAGRLAPPALALRPLTTGQPVPRLVWEYSPAEIVGSHQLILVAYDDGRIIFRAPQGEGYLTLTDTALVHQLYGSEGERAGYAALRAVRMPPEWRVLDGGTETLCVWVRGEMQCHSLQTPMREHVGRAEQEACAPPARGSLSLCRQWNAAHAALPSAFAAYYRRAYDAVRDRAGAATPWVPDRVHLIVRRAECTSANQTPWPAGVPGPRAGERGDGAGVRRLTVTAEQARLLREADHASFTDCLVAGGSAWSWLANYELPNIGVLWRWEG